MLSRKIPTPSLRPAPLPPTPASWPWYSPVLGYIKFAIPRGLSSQWWPTRPSSATYAALRVLISSYCCSTYRVVDPFSSLGTLSSSSIGGPMFHPIADFEHPLLCLPGIKAHFATFLKSNYRFPMSLKCLYIVVSIFCVTVIVVI